MATDFLDVLDPNTGEVLYRAERVRGGRERTPQWIIVWIQKMEAMCDRIAMPEEAVLHWFIRSMHYGNFVEMGSWDVARKFGINERTARKYLAGLVRTRALEKMNKRLYRVSLDLAWRGKISEWHKVRAEQAAS